MKALSPADGTPLSRLWKRIGTGGLALLPFTAIAQEAVVTRGDASPFVTSAGTVNTQGDAVMNADAARAIFGVTGAGVKLGVISDSFNGTGSTPSLATQIAAGNLPGAGNPNGYTTGVTVLKDDNSGVIDEGRAMLEIVHDVAPGAQLYFHSAFNNTQTPGWTGSDTAAPDQTIADAIDNLAAVEGMRVIVDDVGILSAPRFQDGAAAAAVNNAHAAGIGYFSSAGNSGTDSTRVNTSAGPGGTVNWGSDNLLRMTIGGNTTARVVLQWSDPYPSISGPAATSNFSVDAVSVNGSTLFFTTDNQFAGEDPYEFLSITNSGGAGDFALRVNRLSGTNPLLMQLSTFGNITISDPDDTNSATVYGHAAAQGAVAVAAHNWSTPGTVESFSSRGPTTILFDADGNPVNEVRQTPQITAPDGVSTTTSGFTSFFGTSAAAPHAAAVAALVLERLDSKGLAVNTDQLYRILYDSATDIGAAGFDNVSGHGRLDALAAVSAGTRWDGNGSTAGLAGSGSWSQAKWTLETTGDKPTGKFIRGEQAVFASSGSAALTIAVDGAYVVDGLSFESGSMLLSDGGGVLTLSSGTIAVAAAADAGIAGVLGGTAGLTKTGAGRLSLLAASTHDYGGATLVQEGELAVDGTIDGTSSVTVSSGAVLSGIGTIHSSVTVSGSHSPGNSPGIQTVDGNLTYAGGADILWELTANSTEGRGTSYDGIDVTGTLDFSGPTLLDLAFNTQGSSVDWDDAFWAADITGTAGWRIFDLGAGAVLNLVNLSIAAGDWLDSAGGALSAARPGAGFSVVQSGNDLYLNYDVVEPVPEPAITTLLALGCLLSARRRRRASFLDR
jgi:autotransporter-associated beta strand protein